MGRILFARACSLTGRTGIPALATPGGITGGIPSTGSRYGSPLLDLHKGRSLLLRRIFPVAHEGMFLHHGHSLADQFLDILQPGNLLGITERNGFPFHACPGSTANAVDIGFRDVGNVKIDDQGQLFDIDTPGGNIGGHQYSRAAAFKIPEGLLTGTLRFIAMDGGSFYTALLQNPDHLVGPVLSACKDQDRHAGVLLQKMDQQGRFPLLCHHVYRLLHLFSSGLLRLDAHLLGITQNLA